MFGVSYTLYMFEMHPSKYNVQKGLELITREKRSYNLAATTRLLRPHKNQSHAVMEVL